MFSCSSNDDALENTIDQGLQPEKAYTFYTEFYNVGDTPFTDAYYQFTYENGNLKKVSSYNLYPIEYANSIYLFYHPNQVKVIDTTIGQNNDAYTLYTMENHMIVKSEDWGRDFLMNPKVYKTRLYTYEKGVIKVYEKQDANNEFFTNYYFNSDNNLVKKEKIQRKQGVDVMINTYIYSDFDHAKNPFKKLGLVNQTWFDKSLSVNNYRKIEFSYKDLVSGYNSPKQIYNCTYKYGSNGEVMLYHPL